MYMNQSMESFENWRDSQYDRPEPDTDTPDEQIVRSYTFDYPNDTTLTYTHLREVIHHLRDTISGLTDHNLL